MSAGNGRTKSDGRNIEAIKTLSETLPQVNLNAAGIDVGAESHYVAVPDDRAEHPVREFGAYTVDLHRLSDWLAECGVETVALESTGVYWIPLYAVPGRARVRGVARRPSQAQERTGPQDRRVRLPVAPAVAHLRSAGIGVQTRLTDTTTSELPASALDAHRVRIAPHPAHAQGAHADEHQAPTRHKRRDGEDGDGDHRRDPRRRARPSQARAVAGLPGPKRTRRR